MKKIITLKEACAIMGFSIHWGYRNYHLWPQYGVKILKWSPNSSRPRFYEEDIYKMMEKHK